jgi:hypothetical protein
MMETGKDNWVIPTKILCINEACDCPRYSHQLFNDIGLKNLTSRTLACFECGRTAHAIWLVYKPKETIAINPDEFI